VSDEGLKFLVTAGQLGAGILAVVAALAGVISGWAGNELSRRSEAELAELRSRVGVVIGGKWQSLSSSQIAALREKLNSLAKVDSTKAAPRIQVMYENSFGRDLASSIALAFEAARWDARLSPGSGFETGIKIGPGPVGLQLRDIFRETTGITAVSVLRPEEEDRNFYFIGVGAKQE
jgi:hypothetical protein